MSPNATCRVVTDIPTHHFIPITIVYLLLCFFGLLGNILTMVSISSTKNLQTYSNYFIFSLCLSDVISTLFSSPFRLYRVTWGWENWQAGEFLCKWLMCVECEWLMLVVTRIFARCFWVGC